MTASMTRYDDVDNKNGVQDDVNDQLNVSSGIIHLTRSILTTDKDLNESNSISKHDALLIMCKDNSETLA